MWCWEKLSFKLGTFLMHIPSQVSLHWWLLSSCDLVWLYTPNTLPSLVMTRKMCKPDYLSSVLGVTLLMLSQHKGNKVPTWNQLVDEEHMRSTGSLNWCQGRHLAMWIFWSSYLLLAASWSRCSLSVNPVNQLQSIAASCHWSSFVN